MHDILIQMMKIGNLITSFILRKLKIIILGASKGLQLTQIRIKYGFNEK